MRNEDQQYIGRNIYAEKNSTDGDADGEDLNGVMHI